MVLGLLKNFEGFGFLGLCNLNDYLSVFSWINEGFGLYWGIVVVFIVVIFVYVLFSCYIMGFNIKFIGEVFKVVCFGGVNLICLVIFCMCVLGVFVGFVGFFEVFGFFG